MTEYDKRQALTEAFYAIQIGYPLESWGKTGSLRFIDIGDDYGRVETADEKHYDIIINCKHLGFEYSILLETLVHEYAHACAGFKSFKQGHTTRWGILYSKIYCYVFVHHKVNRV